MTEARVQVGGAVQPDCVYVRRPEDDRIGTLLLGDEWFSLTGTHTIGKSSSVIHLGARLQSETHRIIYTDVSAAGPAIDEWFVDFGEQAASEMGIDVLEIRRAVRDTDSPILMLERLLRVLLDHHPGKLTLVLDEIDTVSSRVDAQQIIGAFQGLLSARAKGPDLRRLQICFVGLKPLNSYASTQSGASSALGQQVHMDDFPEKDPVTIDAIASALPPKIVDRSTIVEMILDETGGHPQLTMTLLDVSIRLGVTTTREMQRLITEYKAGLARRREPGNLLDTMERFIVNHRIKAYAALGTYKDLLQDKPLASRTDALGAEVLLTTGLVRVRAGRLRARCKIFRELMDISWADRTRQVLIHSEYYYPKVSFGARQKEAGLHKILVINTGGTVGMVQRGDEVRAPDSSDEFMDDYGEIREIADITFLPLLDLDSINVNPRDWITIANEIYEKRDAGYTGFVVAHGTDTMAHTAAAVAYAMGSNLGFPIVFTGAQTTPDVRHGDARINLFRACLAATLDIPEVVICFGDFLFRGVRAQKKDERRFNGFESPVFPPLATISERITVDRTLVPAASTTETFDVDKQLLRYRADPSEDIDFKPEFADGVLTFALSPGLEPGFFMPILVDRRGPRCTAVMIESPGAGSVPDKDEYSFIPFIERAVSLDIPVFLSSKFPSFASDDTADVRFAPSKAPIEAGAISVGNMTSAAAVVKVKWALAQFAKEGSPERRWHEGLSWYMNHDFVGEVDAASPKREGKGEDL